MRKIHSLLVALLISVLFVTPVHAENISAGGISGGGVSLTTTQTISGPKTFTSDLTLQGLLDIDDGGNNVGIGTTACDSINVNGTQNVCIGTNAGTAITSGDGIIALGFEAGNAATNADGSVYIGFRAGRLSTGGKNVLIGFSAGEALTTESNQLYIDNSSTTAPLIWGDFSANKLLINGVLTLLEQADADDDVAGEGQIWANTATPNELWFTDDAGADVRLDHRQTTIQFIIDGGGAAITTGEKGHLEIPNACTVSAARAFADQSTSTVVDIWSDTYANFPPADADSITASAPVTITTAANSEDTTLTGWTTVMVAGNILAWNVDSNDNATRLLVSLTCDNNL